MPSDLFDELQRATPSPEHVADIRKTLDTGLRAVKPIPSDGVLISLWMAGYFVLAMLLAAVSGFAGFRARGPAQMIVEYSALLGSALLLSMECVRMMVPGSRIKIPVWISILFPLFAMSVVLPMVFPDRSIDNFVQHGIPCLQLGVLCAIPGGALTAFLLRRGYVADWLQAALTASAFSGLLGVGVLAIHCPILNAAHILTWHMGAFLASMAAGAIIGLATARSR